MSQESLVQAYLELARSFVDGHPVHADVMVTVLTCPTCVDLIVRFLQEFSGPWHGGESDA